MPTSDMRLWGAEGGATVLGVFTETWEVEGRDWAPVEVTAGTATVTGAADEEPEPPRASVAPS